MKYLILIFLATAASAAYLPPCYNYEDKVSFSYQACINNNFREAGRELGIFPSYCANFGDTVNYSYLSCINNNFQDASRKLGAYYSSCYNYGDDLDQGFISCVNSNFRNLEWDLRRRRQLKYKKHHSVLFLYRPHSKNENGLSIAHRPKPIGLHHFLDLARFAHQNRYHD